jgi:hypothetical protein
VPHRDVRNAPLVLSRVLPNQEGDVEALCELEGRGQHGFERHVAVDRLAVRVVVPSDPLLLGRVLFEPGKRRDQDQDSRDTFLGCGGKDEGQVRVRVRTRARLKVSIKVGVKVRVGARARVRMSVYACNG